MREGRMPARRLQPKRAKPTRRRVEASQPGGVRGVVVSNAKAELRQFAQQQGGGDGGGSSRHIFAEGACAAAIVEGMRAVGVGVGPDSQQSAARRELAA